MCLKDRGPQRGNFIDGVEPRQLLGVNSSNQQLRSYLKSISKETWQLVNWLTHAQNAIDFHGNLATEATENTLLSFIMFSANHKAPKKKNKGK